VRKLLFSYSLWSRAITVMFYGGNAENVVLCPSFRSGKFAASRYLMTKSKRRKVQESKKNSRQSQSLQQCNHPSSFPILPPTKDFSDTRHPLQPRCFRLRLKLWNFIGASHLLERKRATANTRNHCPQIDSSTKRRLWLRMLRYYFGKRCFIK
jgi:hypothetical protein